MTANTTAIAEKSQTETEADGDDPKEAPTDRYPVLAEADIKADPKLTTMEQELTGQFARDEEMATITSDVPSVTRDLLRHPEYNVVWVRVVDEDGGTARIPPDSYEESDGAIVAVKGKIPIGALKILASSRSKNWPSLLVSNQVTDTSD